MKERGEDYKAFAHLRPFLNMVEKYKYETYKHQ
jgi:hypothetical protein